MLNPALTQPVAFCHQVGELFHQQFPCTSWTSLWLSGSEDGGWSSKGIYIYKRNSTYNQMVPQQLLMANTPKKMKPKRGWASDALQCSWKNAAWDQTWSPCVAAAWLELILPKDATFWIDLAWPLPTPTVILLKARDFPGCLWAPIALDNLFPPACPENATWFQHVQQIQDLVS